jgi:1A family penicillin-binding protein
MRAHRWFWSLSLALLLLGGLAAGGYAWLFSGLPSPEIPPGKLQSPSVRITDHAGRLLYESFPEQGGRHHSLPLEQIPKQLIHATIATEDSHFYTNPGVEPSGILRAAWINLRGGETLAGGSTITQQVARNLLMDDAERGERTLRRKLREGWLAWQLTRRYSKDEILALYLNQSYYGGMAYGVEAAAQTYFGKPAIELSLAECALLAGLPQAPGIYDPFSNPQAALDRRSVVLTLMQKAGYLTAEQHDLAERETLNLATNPYPMEAPHFSLMVRAKVNTLLSPEVISASGGLSVQTTLDLEAQRAAEQAMTRQVERLRELGQRELGYNLNNAALVALDPHTGRILAMVGSPDMQDTAHNGAINMALVPRQPGSALKPIIYAAAFDPTRSNPWTAATSILDVQNHFVTHDGKPYTPANYDGLEHGPVPARQALGSSLNIPAVLTLRKVGLPVFIELAGELGLPLSTNLQEYDLSLALGGREVPLLNLTAAYGAFANGGYRGDPYAVEEIRNARGDVLYQHNSSTPRRVLDERVTWLITDILSDDAARQIGFGRNSMLNIDRPAAVKTGTTTNYHDNWTIGYTPDLVVGVWAGNASHDAMRDVNGLTGAAPIWHQSMRAILAGKPRRDFKRPDGLVQVEVCALSGLLPSPACPYRRMEWFITGTEPVTEDAIYRSVILDSATGQLAGENTPVERRVPGLALDLPPAAQSWARANGMLLWNDLQRTALVDGKREASMATGSELSTNDPTALDTNALLLTSPAPLSRYRLSITLPIDNQRIPLEATGPGDLAVVSLWVDGQRIAALDSPPYRTWWQLAPGKHEAWAESITINGDHLVSSRIEFEVLKDQ